MICRFAFGFGLMVELMLCSGWMVGGSRKGTRNGEIFFRIGTDT